MDEFLYLETDEEITSVIEKLKGFEANSIGLVVPRGGLILQSVVNLKLLKKQADELKKDIALVTQDAVGRNLASQVGLTVFENVDSAEPLPPTLDEKDRPNLNEELEVDMTKSEPDDVSPVDGIEEPVGEEKLPENIRVKRYDENGAEAANTKMQARQSGSTAAENESFTKRPVVPDKKVDRSELESARPIKGRETVMRPKTHKSLKRKFLIIFGTILFVLLLAAADMVVVKLDVKLTVPAEKIERSADVTVEKDRNAIDEINFVIPGKQLDKETTVKETINSSGSKDVGEKAKGTLTFQNESGVDEQISSGATVRNSSGAEFTLDQTITVPKATLNSGGDKILGKTTGNVTAVESGSGSNLSSSTSYSISGKSKITISGSTSGGTTKTIKIVTSSDINEAQSTLGESGKNKVKEEFQKESGFIILDDAITVGTENFKTSKNAGDEADTFEASATAKASVLTFKEADFKKVVLGEIEKNVPDGKSILINENDIITSELKDNQTNIGKLTVTGILTTHLGPNIDQKGLQRRLRMKTKKQINFIIKGINGVKESSYQMSPKYIIPISSVLTRNIIMHLEYVDK